MIDTHSHPYLEEFDADRDEVLQRAFDGGVGHVILPNVDISTIEPMRALHRLYPSTTSMALGLHPTEVKESWRDDLSLIDHEWDLNANDYKAVGEVGIDLYWDKTFREEQMQVLDIQTRRAADMNLPVIIHCREGLDEVLEVLSGLEKKPDAVFHSFGGSMADVDKVRRVGDFYFGINGVVTFKNARLDNTLREITPERIVLETDAPYLAPVPKRGRRNEPAFIAHTAGYVANVFEQSIDKIEDITTANAINLFKLSV
ncbi:MAG: TatD family hydrolase [Muribaculaceae bacterium]|nr:TatD family hydrolase [Muribaculaceae bacterium]